ncbi:MAG: hypothetical protein IK000_05080 [Bacteroidaceae bacterium]|nr:hypothetical protein [Bacteroidaceae bacterium]
MKKIYIAVVLLTVVFGPLFISCDDLLEMGNVDVLYADENHLTEGSDTVNSFIGILAQLQAIAVRTNLFGELRGDLAIVNSNAHTDLKEIANFNVSDDNQYNSPRDYYAIINNCNYYLVNADTTLRESHFNGKSTYDYYVFRAEWTAVRAIRAWVYLQLGQIYGSNIPLVTTPILSIEDADEAFDYSPKMDIAGLCDYFIDDLKPYVSWFAYPYHGNPGSQGYGNNTPSRLSVIPIQLILGDLYLWRASINNNTSDAREAAKCYYDYINWVPSDGGVTHNNSYKVRNTTGSGKCSWSINCFTSSIFSKELAAASHQWYSTSKFGSKDSEVIAVIAMDIDSNKDGYNELRKLYCYDTENENIEASISPSGACYRYSDRSIYNDIYIVDSDEQFATVLKEDLNSELLSYHYCGDLRLPTTLSLVERVDHDSLSQMIEKCYTPKDVILYRTGDVYLRMAEALNYAGFPKFALAILTTGLDDVVIDNEVLAYCTNSKDSAFVQYFEFPTTYYQTRVTDYSMYTEAKGMEYLPVPTSYYSSGSSEINQIGIHSRGSGLGLRLQTVMENNIYYPTAIDVPDNLEGYPVDVTDCSEEEFKQYAETQGIVEPSIADYNTSKEYEAAVEQYKLNYQALFTQKREEYIDNCIEWYKTTGLPQVHDAQVAVVDSLIDAEQALETCFEGFRFGSLMRASYRKGDPTYLAQKVAVRDASLREILSNRDNWFVSWKGQIGK